jgi:hypothetical protein
MRMIPGAVGAVVVAATLVGCGSSPAEQRAEHITRLTESLQARLDLSPTQVECFRVGLDQLSDDDLAQAVSDQPSPAVQDAIVAIGLACYEPKPGTE